MNNTNLIKRTVASALLATMTMTGVGAFTADATTYGLPNSNNIQIYSEKAKQYDKDTLDKWASDFSDGEINGEGIGRTYKPIHKNDIKKAEEALKREIPKYIVGKNPAYISGFTKGILKEFYGYTTGVELR